MPVKPACFAAFSNAFPKSWMCAPAFLGLGKTQWRRVWFASANGLPKYGRFAPPCLLIAGR